MKKEAIVKVESGRDALGQGERINLFSEISTLISTLNLT